jgi:endonuclease YncB( thermonuclease family)
MQHVDEWIVPATVVRVIDGQTLLCHVDLGWNITVLSQVRVAGMDAPPLGQPGGLDAKKYAQRLLPPGTLIRLISHQLLASDDKTPRVSATIVYGDVTDVRSEEGSFVTAMAAAGHARPWTDVGVMTAS